MNINKLAAEDAARWARAEMFFGEGAGTRRKLLSAEIARKVETISEYHELFQKAYNKQNFADHAIKAAKERKSIDRATKLGKNAKALLRGDRRGLSTGLLVIATIVVVAHQTGYDEVALKEAKKYYCKAKLEYKKRQFAHDWTKTNKGN